eukprot:1144571-Pelagomonas_calceolata.AAC.7
MATFVQCVACRPIMGHQRHLGTLGLQEFHSSIGCGLQEFHSSFECGSCAFHLKCWLAAIQVPVRIGCLTCHAPHLVYITKSEHARVHTHKHTRTRAHTHTYTHTHTHTHTQVRALSGSAAFKSDEARFVEVADASLALAQAYLQLYRGSSSSSSAAPPQGTSSSIQNANLNGSNYSAPAQQESAALAPPASSPAVPCAAAAAAAAAATTPLVVQPGSIRELAAARMHLRGLLKQCEPVFGEHAKWQALSNACAEISAAEVDAKSSQQSR